MKESINASPNKNVILKDKPVGGIQKYIKTLCLLTILILIISIVIVGIAIMTASKEFDVDSITENDIPLAIGAGIGLAALVSTISPMNLLEEIDIDKKKKEDKKNNNKKNTQRNSKRKVKTKHPRRIKPRKKIMRPRKMPTRSIRKSSRGLRFLRGLLRLLK